MFIHQTVRRNRSEFKINYQATFAAQLMYSDVDTYEVMPWPDRIYQGLYDIAGTDKKQRIPRDYSTQMQIMINTLNDIKVSDCAVSGTHGIGVLMANSMMFQRFPNHDGYDDPSFSSFYGQTLPLMKDGIPVEIVHMENLPFKQTLADVKVLIMSYSNMKPMEERYHQMLVDWVKNGGALIYCGEDIDPYQQVPEWWNKSPYAYHSPSEHLFELAGLDRKPAAGKYTVGKGKIQVIRRDPKYFALEPDGNKVFKECVYSFYKEVSGEKVELKNNFVVQRGAYVIAVVLDESISSKPVQIKGLTAVSL